MSCRIITILLAVSLSGWSLETRAADTRPWATVKVQTGDTLSAISQRTNTAIDQLMQVNGLVNRDFIRAGQTLRIHPLPARQAESNTRRQHRRSGESELWKTVQVQRNDTLWSIARKYNLKTAYLARINHIKETVLLHPGMKLRVRKRRGQPLMHGVQLPDGDGYVRLRPKRSWGTPGTVKIIQHAYHQFKTLYPDSVPGYVGDLSRKNGGYLPPHVSHQKGTDVDISYYKKNNQRTRGLEVVTNETIDIEKTWELIRLFLNTDHIAAVYMDHKLQRTLYDHLVTLGYDQKFIKRTLQYPRPIRVRQGLIRHSPGHHHHLHVRFDCVETADPCIIPTAETIVARTITPSTPTAPAAPVMRRDRRLTLDLGARVVQSTLRRAQPIAAESRPTRRTLDLPTVQASPLVARRVESPSVRRTRTDISTDFLASSLTEDTLASPDGYLRVVRAQEFEPSRVRLGSPASRIERHWLEVLREQQDVATLWSTTITTDALNARSAEDSERSQRLGLSVQSVAK